MTAMKLSVLLGIWIVGVGAQTPKRTINTAPPPSPDAPSTPSTAKPGAPGGDALSDAFRQQLQRMTPGERQNLFDLNKGNSSVPSSRSTEPPNLRAKPLPAAADRQPDGNALADVDRLLVNSDSIRDRYIDRTGAGNCPPAVLTRLADLKWKLGKKGVALTSVAEFTEGFGDLVAMARDWFKTGDRPPAELSQAQLDDILPLDSISGRQNSPGGEEEVGKMRAEYIALAGVCSSPQLAPAKPNPER